MITNQSQNHHLEQFIKLTKETRVLSWITHRKKRKTMSGTYLIPLVKSLLSCLHSVHILVFTSVFLAVFLFRLLCTNTDVFCSATTAKCDSKSRTTAKFVNVWLLSPIGLEFSNSFTFAESSMNRFNSLVYFFF
jgi:hypothetical protein